MSETLYRLKPIEWGLIERQLWVTGPAGEATYKLRCRAAVGESVELLVYRYDGPGRESHWDWSIYFAEFSCDDGPGGRADSLELAKADCEATYRQIATSLFEPVNEESRSQWKRLYHMRGGEIPG